MADKKATRDGYGKAIAELIKENEKVVVFDADLSGSTKSAEAKKAVPSRHFNAGIAEANMTAMAAGMAASGYIPYISTFAVFGTGRNYDIIRSAVCYPNLNVKIALTHAGLTVGEDGATHQMLEDVALMNALPNMKVFVPSDYNETYAAIKAAAQIDGPVYIRMGREPVDIIYPEDVTFELKKADVLKDGDDIAIFACGIMVEKALKAAEELEKDGVKAAVINVPCIKPLNEDVVLKYAEKTKAVMTCEEHSVYGGLNSVISQLLSEKLPKKVTRVCVEDRFGQSGKAGAVLEEYGLTVENIVKKAKEALA